MAPVDSVGEKVSGISYPTVNEQGALEFEVMVPGDMETPGCYYEIGEMNGDLFFTTSFGYSDQPRGLAEVLRPFPTQFSLNTTMRRTLFTTVRLETRAEGKFLPVGTSFLFRSTTAQGGTLYIVTNKHIVERWKSLYAVMHRGGSINGPSLGRYVRVDLSTVGTTWSHHDMGVDVSVMPYQPAIDVLKALNRDPFYMFWDESMLPGSYVLDNLDVVETVRFIGYPGGIYDSFTQLPIVRQGITATPLWVDYEGKQAFLIDAPVFSTTLAGSPTGTRSPERAASLPGHVGSLRPSGENGSRQSSVRGSSGSPVFISAKEWIEIDGVKTQRDGATLVGILSHFKYTKVFNGESVSEELKDLGRVFRATTIMQAIRVSAGRPDV